MMSHWSQYLTVFAMSASGAVLGAVYDVYRTILAEWRYLRFLGAALDFLFWIAGAGLVLWALNWANDGDIRFYVFLLLAIGLVLYRLLLRKFVVGSTVRMVLALTWFAQMLWRLFLTVVVGPALWLWQALLVLLQGIDRLASVLERAILWPFNPLLRVLTWTGRLLYRWTVQPLIEPVFKPLQQHVVAPVRNFVTRIKQKWKGFLRSVANWLTDSSDQEDDNKPKR